MNVFPFFEWCETTMVGEVIRRSLWLFPVIESFHLVAFAVIGGTILVLDLRLLGVAFRRQPVARIAREAQPWLFGSLSVMLLSGTMLFLSESVKCYYSFAFWVKMISLFVAIIFTLTIRRKVALADEARVGPFWGRLVAFISLGLWGAVAWGGRWIGFS